MFCGAAKQHIRMISERSCDTKDSSNDGEKHLCHHRNTLYFKVQYIKVVNSYFK